MYNQGTGGYPGYPAQNYNQGQYDQQQGGQQYYGDYDQQQQQPPQGGGGGGALTNPFGGGPAAPITSPFGAGAPPPPTASAGYSQSRMAVPPPPTAKQQAERQQQQAQQQYIEPPPSGPSQHHTAAAGGAGRYSQYYREQNVSYPDVASPQNQPAAPDPFAEQRLKECADFSAPPHFVRSTLGKLPNSQSLKQKLHIPISLSFQPLAPVPQGYPETPSVSFGSLGTVVRCKRCRTYINPFVQWEANGRRWLCNLCGYVNETPSFYYCSLDDTARRSDRFERPELCNGSVEYIAPGEYMVRPPQPPVFVFVIEATISSVQSGLLQAAVASIKECFQSGHMPGMQPNNSRCQIGIITFDSAVHFYSLDQSQQLPQMLVVPDLDDLFLPTLPENLVVNAKESETVITSLLDMLPNMFAKTKAQESCLGSAMKAAYMAMKHVGGKMLVFASSLPTVGELPLKGSRDNPRLLNTDKEVELLRPVDDNHKHFAVEMTRVQISLELFCAATQYMDVASLAPLVKFTSGELHYYPSFNIHTLGEKLRGELWRVLTREMGWEAVMRIRVSKGWRIANFYGHLYIRGMDLLVVPNCHADQTFSVGLEMEEAVVQDPVVCVQCALLYTNSSGERRIRVHTICVPVTQSFSDISASIDVQATATGLCHQAIETAIKSKMSDGQSFLSGLCGQIIGAQGTPGQGNQEVVRLLPLYVLGMLKSLAFRATNDVPADLRVYHWTRLETLPVVMMAAFFYPRLLSVHNLAGEEGNKDESGRVALPQQLNLSVERMTQDGAFLVEDGEQMMMWIGRAVSTSWLQSVFGVPAIEQLHPETAESQIGSSGDPTGTKVANVLTEVRAQREPPYMKLWVIRQGDPVEPRFFAALIEDRHQGLGLPLSYAEFLQKIGTRPPAQAAPAPVGAAGAAHAGAAAGYYNQTRAY
uniref:Uncharacterized protein n=1 Tax=Chromera velia CCMP2878 TaxID=1169474 RepID=A0A0G4F9A2_9ALVE|eukprot:Cvel_15857.t1-p1 / transcript=Cvel_15857.t1 / gene=Cvel_15857 / organism=Chromera_velia_CCMP2878 / gene_product=Protein transport protein Sec24-like At3g07100, putative / transcript_product=Protein transport protein Sec24-like At3g07100, putative / location=Cvel_scaffold1195:25086-35022(+) / protein_length=926 / sequence_SO=supercontig / SO=protein_coding / is_pseudo=false